MLGNKKNYMEASQGRHDSDSLCTFMNSFKGLKQKQTFKISYYEMSFVS